MRSLAGALLWCGLGCAPKDIATATCESEMLATGEPWSCVVAGARVGRPSSIHFTTESKNQVAQVKVALTVANGTLRLGYDDLDGGQRADVTPQAPLTRSFPTRLQRDRRSFTFSFEPVGGPVEGLAGTVKYSTP